MMAKDADRYRNERDDLRRQLRLSQEDHGRLAKENKDKELKHKKSVERFEEVEKRWKKIHQDLLDQIDRQEQQIDGKRALWLTANPGSSARRDAMHAVRDPFHSPSASQTPSYMAGAMSSLTSPSIKTPSANVFVPVTYGPPKFRAEDNQHQVPHGTFTAAQSNDGSSFNQGSARTRKNTGPPPTLEIRGGELPYQAPVQNAHRRDLFSRQHAVFGNRPTFRTEPGTPPPPTSSQALVVHKSEEELAEEYKSDLTRLYDSIEDWVRKYSCIPNQSNDRAIASSNNLLWDYMMNCTYPGHRQDSHTHVVALLDNPTTRFWFVMRMTTQYCVRDIMHIKAFRSYNKGVEKTVDTALKKLEERGIHDEAEVCLKLTLHRTRQRSPSAIS